MSSVYQRTYVLKSDYPIEKAMSVFQSYINKQCPNPVNLVPVDDHSFSFMTNRGLDNHLTALIMFANHLTDRGVTVTEFYYDEIRTERQNLIRVMEL